ncbi:hypothetical protein ONZ43_g2018 [Nemania bipapillata]|uniref:Uncharacterized protein n=1 Tax=Nemania bipapillata TaxID=110536 RepID=A0ACC2J2Y1_9PEZI|nr:hypothetical protein ONZ43_g2018 [Nemania bipapillata]
MIGTLQNQIRKGKATSTSQRQFLPINKLDEILTRNTIDGAVKELACDPQDHIKLVDTIYNEGKKVFAMLIYNDCQDLITKFRKLGFLDSQLPLREVDVEKIEDTVRIHRLVEDAQWVFCPYIFPERMWECHRELNEKVILPIINAEQIGAGAYGDVEKISIPSCQQNIIVTKEDVVQFVRKQLRNKYMTEEFKREETCLRMLNQLKHPNIIPLFGSYTYQGRDNFLFPYIEMSLDRFLRSESRYGDFQWDLTFYSALAGLASALSKTHCLHLDQVTHDIKFDGIGYHHDLRPSNVLVSTDTFILADFGLGSLKWADALSHTPFKHVSGDYVAPECTNANEEGQEVGRSIDVWALGCLISEVVTYMLRGKEGLEVFRNKRLTPARLARWKDSSFYQPSGHVKPEVLDWMGNLRGSNSQPDLVPQLLEISRQALTFKVTERPTMEALYQRLIRLSMQKHFQSIQSIFPRVLEIVGSSDQHSLRSLRYAKDRFDAWGMAALADNNVSDFKREEAVAIMKRIFEELQPRAEINGMGDESLIFHGIQGLWDLLPDTLRRSADNQWEMAMDDIEPSQEKRHSQLIAHDDSSTGRVLTDANSLESEFEEAARIFKGSVYDSIPWDKLLQVTSSQSVYDITDEIQNKQLACNGLRNLTKIQPYLNHLEGYAAVVYGIVHGNQQILALLWGPVALLLEWATLRENALDSLVNAIANVGNALPDFQAPPIFDKSTIVPEIALLLFKDLLGFYREALEVFTHPNIGIEHIKQEHEFRRNALESFKEQKRESRRQEFSRLRTSFNPRNYGNTLIESTGGG